VDQIVERAATSPATHRQREKDDQPIETVLGLDASGRPRRSRKKPVVWALALVAIAAAGAYGWQQMSAEGPAVHYATSPVSRGTMIVEVSATGSLQPLTQVEISSELSGVVREVPVGENQRVRAGELLASLDTTRIEAQVDRARANVTAASARVADARITLAETQQSLDRTTQLSGRGMVAEQALETASAARDRAESAVDIALANLAVAEAELKLQQADLDRSSIYAPIDGVVLTRSVNPGQTVAASTSAPILFVLAENLETMELKAAIDEADIGAVAAGQTARFTVDAFPGRRFDAQIRDIAYASVTTEGVVTYEARLDVDNAQMVLRPGMTATVDIVTREADGVLLVPAAAFRFSPQQEGARRSFSLQSMFMPQRPRMGAGRGAGQRSRAGGDEGRPLYVLRDGEPQMVRVETGASDGEMMEVISGLQEGDEVIVSARQAR
jgi:HlyD family secretion protein